MRQQLLRQRVECATVRLVSFTSALIRRQTRPTGSLVGQSLFQVSSDRMTWRHADMMTSSSQLACE